VGVGVGTVTVVVDVVVVVTGASVDAIGSGGWTNTCCLP
jgi:hypothetical protein